MQEIIKLWPQMQIWQHLHGASSHFPIALIIVSFLFDFGAVLFKRPTWHIVGFWTLIVATVVAVLSLLSGFTGYLGWFGVEKYDVSGENLTVLLTHRNLALTTSGGLLIMTVWRLLRQDAVKGAEMIAYLVVLTITTVVVGLTGYLGAYIVHGIG